jgi:hypothetical protein
VIEERQHPDTRVALERAEREYQEWCRTYRLDPEDVATMLAYEKQYEPPVPGDLP